MARLTQDGERQRSHSMASTTAVEGHHPPMTPRNTFAMDNDRFQSQLYVEKEPGNGGSCYTPAPYPHTDCYDTQSVQRDYTRKNIDITYTDGSGDKKWSSRDFSWTKELEVILFKIYS
jgi:bloom syndrome protein